MIKIGCVRALPASVIRQRGIRFSVQVIQLLLGGMFKMAKWVYLFSEGNANMRNLLGGKGANLAEMTNLGHADSAGLHCYN